MTWQTLTSGVKEVSQAAREIAVTLCVGAVIFWPSGVGEYIDKVAHAVHASEVDLGWVKMTFEQQKDQAEKTDQVTQQIEKVTDQIAAIQAKTPDPQTKTALSAAVQQLETSRAQAQQAGEIAKAAIAVTQQLDTELAPVRGWIYLGKLSDAGSGVLSWLPGQPQTIDRVEPADIEPGKELTIRDDVYLRTPSDPAKASTAPIMGVLAAGSKVKVVDAINTASKSADGSIRYAWVIVERE
jgi:hypothetical protein